MSIRPTFGPLTLFSAAVICCNLACGSTRERGDGAGQVRDGGAQVLDSGSGATLNPNLKSYGSGDHAILLSEANPRRYCWYIEETLRICMGSPPTQDRAYNDLCYDDETNCLARQPEDQERDTGTCWTRIDVENVSGGALYGSCDRVDAYQRRDPGTQCLYHGQCPSGRLCADYQCVCPPGVECGCFECGPPPPPRCDGNVLVTMTPGQGCDQNDRCWFEEQRTDCGANLGTCDPIRGACEGGLGVDAGGAGGGADAGPNPVDGGGAGGGDPDVECRQDNECPGPGPLPPGACQRPLCDQNVCTLVDC